MEKEVQLNGTRTGFPRGFGKLLERPEKKQANISQISFGVAPAMCAFTLGLRSTLDTLILTFFVLCGLTRLARFNVTAQFLPKDATGKSHYFEGTPIPTTLSIAAAMAVWVKKGWVHDQIPFGVLAEGTALEVHPVALVFALWGCMMTSKSIKIPKP